MTSNLRNAPLFLTPQVVRGALGIGHARNMAVLPVENLEQKTVHIPPVDRRQSGEASPPLEPSLPVLAPIKLPSAAAVVTTTVDQRRVAKPEPAVAERTAAGSGEISVFPLGDLPIGQVIKASSRSDSDRSAEEAWPRFNGEAPYFYGVDYSK